MKLGNLSSDLSKLIRIVQLLIFYHSAQRDRRGDKRTLAHEQDCCGQYLRQGNKTPMGEILRWRLLLFHVREHSVGNHQAT